MTTKLITAGVILVVAILFGFIFWNQFSSNQEDLAGGDNSQINTNSQASTVPQNDSLSSIEESLEGVNVNVDSDSSQLDSELNGF